MNKNFLLAVATAAGMAAAATVSLAAPLPAGTKLTFFGTTDAASLVKCSNGSCFGMLIAPGLYFWTPLFSGTDGGIVIGKPQKSGGQELNYAANANGEMTAAWNFAANNGTFSTAPSDAGNVFDDASCTGSGCGSNTTPRKTDLAVWNMAWNGAVIPLGSSEGCDPLLYFNCTTDQQNGIFVKSWTIDPVAGTWRLEYGQVTKSFFVNFPFELVLRGKTGDVPLPPINTAPVANDIQLEGGSGDILTWIPGATDPDGPGALSCNMYGQGPAHGSAVIASDCSSGSYISAAGYVGADSFIYSVSDERVKTYVTVTANITGVPPTACMLSYPVRSYTYSSKDNLTLMVTGNISKTTNKEVRICPTTQLEYNATSKYPVTCYINNVVAAPKGLVEVGSQLKCDVKPYAGAQFKLYINSAI
jgi:hypothetical protein